VTIVSVNGRDPERSIRAIRHSSTSLCFAESLLITNRDLYLTDIRTINAGGLTSIADYNIFIVNDLHRHITTDFCLIVQSDGFVVNPWLWTDFYLHYDYIGAPWNMICSLEVLMKSGLSGTSNVGIIVGNGGFSLRSKRFLEASSQLDYKTPDLEEDCFLAVKNRAHLEGMGMRFAPVALARQFSLETCYDGRSTLGNHFGFHGRFPHFDEYLAITHPEKESSSPPNL
jgi:hypothetical protein